jgi:hypothetical protein
MNTKQKSEAAAAICKMTRTETPPNLFCISFDDHFANALNLGFVESPENFAKHYVSLLNEKESEVDADLQPANIDPQKIREDNCAWHLSLLENGFCPPLCDRIKLESAEVDALKMRYDLLHSHFDKIAFFQQIDFERYDPQVLNYFVEKSYSLLNTSSDYRVQSDFAAILGQNDANHVFFKLT